MENHALSIGTMKTDCKVLSYPPALAVLRSTLDSALSGPFPALLANASGPWLEGLEGVVRIKCLKLELAYNGSWDEADLAEMLAARVCQALRSALKSQSSDIRVWSDHVNYMASYIEWQLGLAHESSWAFPDFHALRLLPPLEASLEIVKARPAVLAAMAANGRRTGNLFRFVDKLNSNQVAQLVAALAGRADVRQIAAFASRGSDEVLSLVDALESLQEPDIGIRILKLASICGATVGYEEFASLFGAAILAVVCQHLSEQHQLRESTVHHGFEIALASASRTGTLPLHLAQFTKLVLRNKEGTALANTLISLLEKRSNPASSSRENQAKKPATTKLKSLIFTSVFAGFALLLPDAVRLSLTKQLGLRGMREAVLSIADQDVRERLESDALIAALFPDDGDADEPVYPPVSEIGIARLAPESRALIISRQGSDGWGDYLLASFASRLPGLRASTRGYLLRQFLRIQGRAEISDELVSVTLDGPPLSIILKMAGLSGDQMRVPHLNNRLLILNVGATV